MLIWGDFWVMRAQLVLRAMRDAGSYSQAYCDAGVGDADGADEQAHAMLLPGKYVLDRRAHGGPFRIGARDVSGHGFGSWLLLVDDAVNMPRSRKASFFFER